MRDAGIIGVYGDQSSSSRQASMPTIDELEKAKSEIESIFDMYVYLIDFLKIPKEMIKWGE